jgi:hypothetical protein
MNDRSWQILLQKSAKLTGIPAANAAARFCRSLRPERRL